MTHHGLAMALADGVALRFNQSRQLNSKAKKTPPAMNCKRYEKVLPAGQITANPAITAQAGIAAKYTVIATQRSQAFQLFMAAAKKSVPDKI